MNLRNRVLRTHQKRKQNLELSMAGSGSEEPSAQPFWRIPISDLRPTPGHLITAAASLRLGHLLHQNLRHGTYLQYVPKLHQDHVPKLDDACSTFHFNRFKIIKSPNEGVSISKQSPRNGSNSTRQLTNILLTANLLAHVAQAATRGKLTAWGAKINCLIDKGQWWRLVTSSFLHADVLHLLFSSFCLNKIGPSLETFCGPRRYLAVYFISAIAGSTMSYRFSKSPSFGASGAICGLAGSFVVHTMRHWDMLGCGREKLELAAKFIALNMLVGLNSTHINNWGHLGGFLGGAAATWFVGPAWKYESRNADGKKVFINRAPITYLLNTKPESRIITAPMFKIFLWAC